MTLDFVNQKTFSGQTQKLVVFLHGYGADGHDLIDLASHWKNDLPCTEFLSPHAPFPCEESPFGRQWFSLRDRDPNALEKNLKTALPLLNAFLDTVLKERNLSDEDLCLVGFSQGTMMGLSCALSRPKACAGVLGYSGAFLSRVNQNVVKPPIYLIHGKEDKVVPFDAMEKAQHQLQNLGLSVQTLARPGLEHGIDPDGLYQGGLFIKNCLKH